MKLTKKEWGLLIQSVQECETHALDMISKGVMGSELYAVRVLLLRDLKLKLKAQRKEQPK